MRPQPDLGTHSIAILFQQDLALVRCYVKMVLHRLTSEVSDKPFHLSSLGVEHFPFNVELFSLACASPSRLSHTAAALKSSSVASPKWMPLGGIGRSHILGSEISASAI